MGDDRPGEGETTSRAGAKQQMGRSFVISGKGSHEGRSAAHKTELIASDRLAREKPESEIVPDLEWKVIEEEYPRDTSIMQQQGFSRRQIVDAINEREHN